jgi:hypothetical protein
MLPESFAGAFLPQCPVRILGRTLRPFCLWHQFALQVIESPFVTGAGMTLIDLDFAARICAAPAGINPEVLLRANEPPSLWQKLRLVRLARRYSIETEADRFAVYMRHHCQFPEFWSSADSGGDELSAPPVIGSIVAQLIKGGYREPEAWAMQPGRAHWMAALFARLGGADIRFFALSPEQIAAAEQMKADYAARKAARVDTATA